MEENEAQLRLAIEERELSKMAAVSKQDEEMQNLLSAREEELGERSRQLQEAQKRVDELQEKVREQERRSEVQVKVGMPVWRPCCCKTGECNRWMGWQELSCAG